MSEKNPQLEKLVHVLDENHATDILVIDVRKQTAITDYMIICNARSSRHVRAVTDRVMTDMKAIGLQVLGHHGTNEGEWALVDFADFIVNIMQPTARDFYNLEGLWQPQSEKIPKASSC